MKFKIFICVAFMTIWAVGGVIGFVIDNEWYMRASIILLSIFGVGFMILSEIEELQERLLERK